jgi:hypothetical protein
MTTYQLPITSYHSPITICQSSIKNNKLCETKPIYEEPKMTLNHYITKDYENKSGLLTMEKQTQTNPNKPNFKGGFRIWLNGIDSVELAEQRGRQTNLTAKNNAHLRNVTLPEISGYANGGLGWRIWHDICSY